MSAEPGQVYRGQNVELAYSVSNSGNEAIDELGLYIKLVSCDTASGSWDYCYVSFCRILPVTARKRLTLLSSLVTITLCFWNGNQRC